jgi:AraC-like DNA-binding protein
LSEERLIPAFILRGFWDELEKRGVSIAELERAAHVSRPRSGDFGSLISETAMYALFEAAQVVSGDATIGLTTGRAIGSSGFHVLGHLALAGNNLAQAVALLAQAQPQIAAHALLDDLGDGQMRFGFLRTDACASPGARMRAELSAVLLHDVALHYFLPGTRELPRVQLAFPPPANRAPYERAFPGGVEFDGQGTFVFFRRAALARHRSGADPWLRDQLFKLAVDRYGTAKACTDWSGRVRQALRAHAAPRLVDLSALAEQCGVSRRGLSRRLAKEGVTVSELIDEVLFERARPLLRRPGATATQVAEALGYAELSSFFRAFRRWSGGLTPSDYRRLHAATDNRAR